MRPYAEQALEAEQKGEYGKAEKLWQHAKHAATDPEERAIAIYNFLRVHNIHTKRLRENDL